ncbi:MAG: hypothetical protein M3Y57_09215 [Acidobacteriota bacterium]|nr:hypothetical protein [Acidobacteriota bacterium]
MATSDDRKKRGQEILKKYRSVSGSDAYSAASDAIADILLSVAQNEQEATRILHAAEVDYRSTAEGDDVAAEG